MDAELNSRDVLEAGTGFMPNLRDVLRQFMKAGYSENLGARLDHFECRSGQFKFYPHEIVIDSITRFENTSDPDDQSILYAISVPGKNLKGLYVEAYGIDQDELSREMIERLKNHPH